jgi:8-oxo-dGTP diphosphatase
VSDREEVAVGIIAAPDGRLLLQLRDERDGLPAAGMWGLVGGHVEHDERPQDAFLRELDEELGWRPRRFEPYLTRDVDGDGWRNVRSHVFAAQLDVEANALRLGEGQRLGLFAPDALPNGIVAGIIPVIAEFARSDVYVRMRRVYERVFTAGLVVDGKGRFLLQHRDDRPSIINPGMWATFGGHLEPYETPEDGFLREMEEELVWRPAHHELAWVFECDCHGPEHLVYDFAAPLDVPAAALELHEGQGMGWFAPDALPELQLETSTALIALARSASRPQAVALPPDLQAL